jgi:hypothetical protein
MASCAVPSGPRSWLTDCVGGLPSTGGVTKVDLRCEGCVAAAQKNQFYALPVEVLAVTTIADVSGVSIAFMAGNNRHAPIGFFVARHSGNPAGSVFQLSFT